MTIFLLSVKKCFFTNWPVRNGSKSCPNYKILWRTSFWSFDQTMECWQTGLCKPCYFNLISVFNQWFLDNTVNLKCVLKRFTLLFSGSRNNKHVSWNSKILVFSFLKGTYLFIYLKFLRLIHDLVYLCDYLDTLKLYNVVVYCVGDYY